MMPDFTRYDLLVMNQDAPIRVSVEPDALLFWWGGDVGPQDAKGLVTAHIAQIEAVVIFKASLGAFEPDGSILVSEDDLD